MMVIKTTYTEIDLNNAEKISRFFTNPKTKTYQYEYALYEEVKKLFKKVVCNSLCLESLKLYFAELPEKNEKEEEHSMENAALNSVPEEENKPKRSKESVTDEIRTLVQRDVLGYVEFPMMNECMAEARIIRKDDGSHLFIFSDGLNSFSVSLGDLKKGHPRRLVVKDYSNIHAAEFAA